MIKVTYLDHSAFLVELTHHVLLFDHAAITPPPIPAGKSLYVFASHAHSHLSAAGRCVLSGT